MNADSYEPNPPQNLEAEEYVLGAVMLAPTAIDACLDERLTGRDFYRGSHGLIFDVAVAMYAENDHVDAITLADRLDREGHLDKVGGKDRIRELATLVPASSNAGHHARVVKEMSILRALVLAGHEIGKLGWERGANVRDLLDRAEGIVFDLAQVRQTSDFVTIKETIHDSYDRITDLYENGRTAVTGVPSGFYFLDNLTSGFQKGNLVIVAARPSMGKTAFALSITAHVAVRLNLPVVVFTMEMSQAEITDRLLSSEASVESEKIRNGKLSGEEWGRIAQAASRLEKAPIVIDDSAMVTAMELRSKARKAKLRYPDLALVVVDYLQLMTAGGTRQAENRVQDVSQISRTMKVLARELDVPVLALSQLSRQVEQRHDKRPILSDLRESGSLEQDADVCAFIYRDEYYSPEDTDQLGIAEVCLAKHRNGPTGTIKLAFVKRHVRFSNLGPDGQDR